MTAMTAFLARVVLVLGFCAATVGAAGFAEPVEGLAWPLFLLGLAAVLGGGLVLRSETRRRVELDQGGALSQAGLAAALHDLTGRLGALDEEKQGLAPEELCQRIDALLAGPYFELGARNEDYFRALGPGAYTRIWEGFAISERLLARAWSMAADGHPAQALEELPRSLDRLAQAAQQADQA